MSTLNDKSVDHHVIISAPRHSWADGEPQKLHSVLAQSTRRSRSVSCWHEKRSPVLPFGMILRESWFRTMRHTPIFLMSVPNIFPGWNGNTQWSRTRNIEDAMRLFQINDLVMFGYACPSHFRPRFYEPWCALLMFTVTHVKLDFRLPNVCHCFVPLDRKEAWQVINFSKYWK